MLTKVEDKREWLPIMEVCQMIGVSRTSIYRRLKRKVLRGRYDVRGRLHINRASLNRHLADTPEFGER